MKRQIFFVVAVAVFVSAGALLIGTLQHRSERIAALKREIVVTQEQQNAARLRQLLKIEDLLNLQTPVGDYLTPLERERRSPRRGAE